MQFEFEFEFDLEPSDVWQTNCDDMAVITRGLL